MDETADVNALNQTSKVDDALLRHLNSTNLDEVVFCWKNTSWVRKTRHMHYPTWHFVPLEYHLLVVDIDRVYEIYKDSLH